MAKLLQLGFLCVLVISPVEAWPADKCNPPDKVCGDGDYQYRCPPCAPEEAFGPESAEEYRKSLERYREGLELDRQNGKSQLPSYKKGIADYSAGIASYRSTVRQSAATPK